MTWSLFLAVASAYLAAAFLGAGIFRALWGERLAVARRAGEVLGGSLPASLREEDLRAPLGQRVVRPLLKKLSRAARGFIPAERAAAVERKLLRAGRPGGLEAREFTALKYLAAVALAGLFSWLAARLHVPPPRAYLFSLLGASLGWYLPDFYLEARIRERQEAVRRELPEVLDLLTVCVEAGLGFDGALLKVAEKKKGLLPREFMHLLQEVNMGRPRREAFRDLAERLGVEEFSSFAGAVITADRLGISLSNVLRASAAQMRLKRRQRAEELAMKAPVKMLFPLVFCIFPAVFLVLLGPAFIKIMQVFGR
ncbi:type II secretion system F family protein [Desulfovirgula thermocuniculi]|uniref:type II secretion system F family protein n=1 Tax=Desulfovirgula thermocuniculi TaxID=348842 RepID=UPI00041EC11C|nr:type II secretion system F family protein [Desulfovirgula thermocuniculi]